MKDGLWGKVVESREDRGGLVEGGGFGKMGEGCKWVVGRKVGMRLGEYVVREGGLGGEVGGEKL